MNVGMRIKKLRKMRNMTQKELAERVDVSINTVKGWETDRFLPVIDKIGDLANVLGTDANYFFADEMNKFQEFTEEEKSRIMKMRHLDNSEIRFLDSFLDNLVELHFEKEAALEELKSQKDTYTNPYEDAEINIESINYLTFPFFPDRPSAGTGSMMYDQSPFNVQVKETPEAKKADFVLQVEGDSMEPKYHNDDFVLVRKQDVVDNNEIGIFLYDGNVYIKQLKDDLLHSLNPAYDDIRIDGEIICFGKVLGKAEI